MNPITQCCVPISCRYYRLHKAKENYRIFTNQQRREDSVDGSLSESIAGVNPAAMAYDNPVFLDKTLESTNEQSNDDDVDTIVEIRNGRPSELLGGGHHFNDAPQF